MTAEELAELWRLVQLYWDIYEDEDDRLDGDAWMFFLSVQYRVEGEPPIRPSRPLVNEGNPWIEVS